MQGDEIPGSGQGGGSFRSILGDSCSFLGTSLGKELTDPYSGFSNISGFISCRSSCGRASAVFFPRSLGLGHREEKGEGQERQNTGSVFILWVGAFILG
jgi:hypothetical protein